MANSLETLYLPLVWPPPAEEEEMSYLIRLIQEFTMDDFSSKNIKSDVRSLAAGLMKDVAPGASKASVEIEYVDEHCKKCAR